MEFTAPQLGQLAPFYFVSTFARNLLSVAGVPATTRAAESSRPRAWAR